MDMAQDSEEVILVVVAWALGTASRNLFLTRCDRQPPCRIWFSRLAAVVTTATQVSDFVELAYYPQH
jgi:hypothetical protein